MNKLYAKLRIAHIMLCQWKELLDAWATPHLSRVKMKLTFGIGVSEFGSRLFARYIRIHYMH